MNSMRQEQRNSAEETKETAARLTEARLKELDADGNPVFKSHYPKGYRNEVHPELDGKPQEPQPDDSRVDGANAEGLANRTAAEVNPDSRKNTADKADQK